MAGGLAAFDLRHPSAAAGDVGRVKRNGGANYKGIRYLILMAYEPHCSAQKSRGGSVVVEKLAGRLSVVCRLIVGEKYLPLIKYAPIRT